VLYIFLFVLKIKPLTHVHTNLLRDCEIREKSVQEKPYITNGRKIILSVLSTFWLKLSTNT